MTFGFDVHFNRLILRLGKAVVALCRLLHRGTQRERSSPMWDIIEIRRQTNSKKYFRYFIKITSNFDILTKDTYKFIIIINHWRANHYHFIISINARCDCYIIYIVIIYISYEQDLNIIMILIRLSKSYSVK